MVTAIDTKTALVLIDLQKGITGMPTAHPTADVIAKSAELVAAFRKKNMPVVIVNVNPLGAKWTQVRTETPSVPKDPEAVKGARAAMEQGGFFDIVPEIITVNDDIFITKESWSAFYNTKLDEELQKRGVTGIVLAGVATSVGVEGTARNAVERGYHIAFATDAMTDMNQSAHDHSISLIFPRIGETGTTAEIISKINE